VCCSGHAYQSELEEILKTVKPKHFLPVHGEASFLYAHAQLAQDLGCHNTSVIRNGELLGVSDIRSKQHVSMGTAAVRPVIQLLFKYMFEQYCAGNFACTWRPVIAVE
jgi:mRNA degradation ribonuclease J1/J2